MLTLHNLAFERNQQFLFSHLDETLQAGDLLQIRGENGSGKSTLLRILTGLLEPHEGTLLWENQPITEQKEFYQQQLRYIGHQNGIKSYLTVHENLKLQYALQRPLDCRGQALRGLAITGVGSDQTKAILEKINLAHVQHKQALHLSSGQLRRLSLAKLLLNPVPLWILDEPATALDANGQQLLVELVKQHISDGGMAILATHQALALTGKIIQLGKQYV